MLQNEEKRKLKGFFKGTMNKITIQIISVPLLSTLNVSTPTFSHQTKVHMPIYATKTCLGALRVHTDLSVRINERDIILTLNEENRSQCSGQSSRNLRENNHS